MLILRIKKWQLCQIFPVDMLDGLGVTLPYQNRTKIGCELARTGVQYNSLKKLFLFDFG